jgi:hypothetical protein
MDAARPPESGFALLETLLGTVLLLTVVVGISVAILHSTKSNVSFIQNQRIYNISEMAFEQLGAVALENYRSLPLFDVTDQPAAEFLKLQSARAYEGLRITTRSEFSQNRSSCTVTMTITNVKAAGRKEQTFRKIFSESTPLMQGGLLQVWVKPRCSGYTDPADIRQHCPGLRGVKVEATAMENPSLMTSAITDSAGKASLRRVAIGEEITLRVTAPEPSSFSTPITDPAFVPAYFTPSGAGFSRVLTSTVTVDDQVIAEVLIDSFLSAGVIRGYVSAASGGVLDGMKVSLTQGTASDATGLRPCTTVAPCTVLSHDGGQYSFSNVLPGAVTIVGTGRAGSSPTVASTQPEFVQGYMNPTPINAVLSDTTLSLVQDVVVTAYGGLVVRSVRNGLPYGNFTFDAIPRPIWVGNRFRTDANGFITIHNFLIPPNCEVTFTAYNPASGGNPATGTGGYGDFRSACLGTLHPVELNVALGKTVTIPVMDDSGSTQRIETMKSEFMTGNTWGLATQNPSHVLTMSDVVPTGSPLQISFRFENKLNGLNVTLLGMVTDKSPSRLGRPAAGAVAVFTAVDAAGATYYYSSIAGADGRFTAVFETPWYATAVVPVTCDEAAGTCVATASSFNLDGDTGGFQNSTPVLTNGWLLDTSWMSITDGETKAYNMRATLVQYKVRGQITNSATGSPLQGAAVYDNNNRSAGPIATTDANGFYEGWVKVLGDAVGVYVPEDQTLGGVQHHLAGSSVASQAVPSTATPLTPLIFNFQMSTTGGGVI